MANITLSGGTGNDTLTGSPSNTYTIYGFAGDDVLVGAELNDLLDGGDGNDTLDGGIGTDTMLGGNGNDTYIVDNIGDIVTETSGGGTDLVKSSVSYTLSANVENLTLIGSSPISGTGNSLDNTLIGNGAANTLVGGAGNDWLNGASGGDTLRGGTGNDIYVVNSTSDTVTENSGEGTDAVRTGISYSLTANVENLAMLGSAAISGTGNSLDNTLTGNSAANTLDGGLGNDFLNGSWGADTLIGGLGNDTYSVTDTGDVVIENADEGTDTVNSQISYTLPSNVENLVLTGTAVIDGTGNSLANTLTGNSLANTLDGDVGDDTLNGGVGADTLIGGTGNDTYFVDNTGDVVVENTSAGTDTVNSSADYYTLSDNVENLVLTGAAIGGVGNSLPNTLTGSSIANALDGGTGADTLIGGAGNDGYAVDSAGDVIVENPGEGFDLASVSISSYTLPANVEQMILTGSPTGPISANGNDLDNGIDVILSTPDSPYVATVHGYGGNDYIWGAPTWSGPNHLYGDDGDDTLEGGSFNDILDGGNGDDNLWGGPGDTIYGGAGSDHFSDGVDSGSGQTFMYGGNGSDVYESFYATDYIFDSGATTDIDTVNVYSASLGGTYTGTYILPSSIENLLLGDGVSGTGNASNNRIDAGTGTNIGGCTLDGKDGNDALLGGTGNDTLLGGIGNDYLDGRTGADTLTGGTGNDTFVFHTVAGGADTVVDFQSGDKLQFKDVNSTSGLGIGDGDHVIDNATTINGPGGFSNTAELVVVTSNISGAINTTTAAADIGSATTAYALDDTRLFVVDNGTDSAVYLFHSSGNNAQVSASELTLVATLQGTAQTATTDYIFDGTLIGEPDFSSALYGGSGNDILDDTFSNGRMIGGGGADTFRLTSIKALGGNALSDFQSGTDTLEFKDGAAYLGIGNGDHVIDQATTAATGGFSTANELVVITSGIPGSGPTSGVNYVKAAAAVIGSAQSSYALGDTRLFAVHNSTDTGVYLFHSSGNDAEVSASELTMIGTLSGTAQTTTTDYLFVA